MEKHLAFFKLHGCGNDFILVDIRSKHQEDIVVQEGMEHLAKKLCQRNYSIGADGIIFIAESENPLAQYKWHFYNADGSRASMCGNATRCVAYWAVLQGIAHKEHAFESDIGLIYVTVQVEENLVSTSLPAPHSLKDTIQLTIDAKDYSVSYVNTGVPHVVCFVDDVRTLAVDTLGRSMRFAQEFSPDGANVNFAQYLDNDTFLVRTYERGVEAETFACGTGACAVAVVAHRLLAKNKTITLKTLAGDTLVVSDMQEKIVLQAPACLVYKGTAFIV